jgi:hypothetical protein
LSRGLNKRDASLGFAGLARFVRPRIASWDILSRPCGTVSSGLVGFLTQALEAVPYGTGPWCQYLPRTDVLGYSQPSLRDCVIWIGRVFTQALKAVPYSPCPSGARLVPQGVKPCRTQSTMCRGSFDEQNLKSSEDRTKGMASAVAENPCSLIGFSR